MAESTKAYRWSSGRQTYVTTRTGAASPSPRSKSPRRPISRPCTADKHTPIRVINTSESKIESFTKVLEEFLRKWNEITSDNGLDRNPYTVDKLPCRLQRLASMVQQLNVFTEILFNALKNRDFSIPNACNSMFLRYIGTYQDLANELSPFFNDVQYRLKFDWALNSLQDTKDKITDASSAKIQELSVQLQQEALKSKASNDMYEAEKKSLDHVRKHLFDEGRDIKPTLLYDFVTRKLEPIDAPAYSRVNFFPRDHGLSQAREKIPPVLPMVLLNDGDKAKGYIKSHAVYFTFSLDCTIEGVTICLSQVPSALPTNFIQMSMTYGKPDVNPSAAFSSTTYFANTADGSAENFFRTLKPGVWFIKLTSCGSQATNKRFLLDFRMKVKVLDISTKMNSLLGTMENEIGVQSLIGAQMDQLEDIVANHKPAKHLLHKPPQRDVETQTETAVFDNKPTMVANKKGSKYGGFGPFLKLGLLPSSQGRARKLAIPVVMRLIHQIYIKKMETDEFADKANRDRQELCDFVYHFFLKQHGLRELSEYKLHELLYTLRSAQKHNARIKDFMHFVGLLTPCYELDALNVYLFALQAVNKGCEKYGFSPSTSDKAWFVPDAVAYEVVKKVFSARCSVWISDLCSAIDITMRNKHIPLGKMHGDLFLSILIQSWFQQATRDQFELQSMFRAVDEEGKAYLTYSDFLTALDKLKMKYQAIDVMMMFVSACTILNGQRVLKFPAFNHLGQKHQFVQNRNKDDDNDDTEDVTLVANPTVQMKDVFNVWASMEGVVQEQLQHVQRSEQAPAGKLIISDMLTKFKVELKRDQDAALAQEYLKVFVTNLNQFCLRPTLQTINNHISDEPHVKTSMVTHGNIDWNKALTEQCTNQHLAASLGYCPDQFHSSKLNHVLGVEDAVFFGHEPMQADQKTDIIVARVPSRASQRDRNDEIPSRPHSPSPPVRRKSVHDCLQNLVCGSSQDNDDGLQEHSHPVRSVDELTSDINTVRNDLSYLFDWASDNDDDVFDDDGDIGVLQSYGLNQYDYIDSSV